MEYYKVLLKQENALQISLKGYHIVWNILKGHSVEEIVQNYFGLSFEQG